MQKQSYVAAIMDQSISLPIREAGLAGYTLSIFEETNSYKIDCSRF